MVIAGQGLDRPDGRRDPRRTPVTSSVAKFELGEGDEAEQPEATVLRQR